MVTTILIDNVLEVKTDKTVLWGTPYELIVSFLEKSFYVIISVLSYF